MNQPLVNIMMPVLNGMPLLRASIESIKRQTYPNWQCIICDDGSTDGTSEFLQELLQEETLNRSKSIEPLEPFEPRFVVLTNKTNMGRGYSRQRILETCTAPYICMLDSGDLMHPQRIERQVQYLQANPQVGLTSSAMLSFGTKTDTLVYRASGRTPDHIETFNGTSACCFAPCMFRNPQAHVSFNSTLRFCEDQHFLRQYLLQHSQFLCMSQPLYYYSEFDSCDKRKTRRAYRQDMLTYYHERLFPQALTCLLKLIYSYVVFPFVSNESILRKRGREATVAERAEFNQFGRTLL